MSAETEERQGVVVYETSTAAYASERVLQRAGLEAKVIPVPRSLSTDCCLGLRIRWDDREQAQELLRAAGIAFVAVFEWP